MGRPKKNRGNGFITRGNFFKWDLLAALQHIIQKWLTFDTGNEKQAIYIQANLTQADLTQANLIQAGLTQADLTQAGLTQADLTQAGLTQAVSCWRL